MSIDITKQFREVMWQYGITPPETIQDDGQLHRFSINERHLEDAGWYIFYSDGVPMGSFGDCLTESEHVWRAEIGRKLTTQEASEYRQRLDNIRQIREMAEDERYTQAISYREKSHTIGIATINDTNIRHIQNRPQQSKKPDNTEIKKIIAISLSELLAKELPPRENILDPWLPKAGLCMVYAERDVGKTFFALEIAMAVASGSTFLSFAASKPRKVLYLDGEMPANTMQERLARINSKLGSNPNMIEPILITPDLQTQPMPNLSTPEGQELIIEHLKDVDLIVIDNISTLCGNGNENESDGWIPIQQWVLQLRRQGKAVLFVHHAGKNGTQRGTSKREDILDTVIKLKHSSDYEPSMGASFEIHFEKARGMLGNDTTPLKCELKEDGWLFTPLEETNYEKVIECYRDSLKQQEIVEELDLSKGYVSKLLKRARASGRI